jgi:hypothetical protein
VIQAAAVGGGLWFFAWCVILCYIFEWNKEPKEGRKIEPLTLSKIVNNATKLVVAIFALLPMFVFAQMFELWVKVSGNIEQSLDLLRTVSNIAVSVAIGGITAYVAYQKYQIDRRLAQMEINKKQDEFVEKYRKRMGIPPSVY